MKADSMTRDDYLAMRKAYEPEQFALIIVGEAPPASGLYLYNKDGKTSEPLFRALMKQIGYDPTPATNKHEGLCWLRQSGWLFVDATYEHVDKPRLSPAEVACIIKRDYGALRYDLLSLMRGERVPIVIIKANVCRLLDSMLTDDDFNVLNRGRIICFPAQGWEHRPDGFHAQFDAVVGLTLALRDNVNGSVLDGSRT